MERILAVSPTNKLFHNDQPASVRRDSFKEVALHMEPFSVTRFGLSDLHNLLPVKYRNCKSLENSEYMNMKTFRAKNYLAIINLVSVSMDSLVPSVESLSSCNVPTTSTQDTIRSFLSFVK